MRMSTKIILAADLFRAWRNCRRGGDPERILVVRLDGFGDFSLYLPCALALREIYPRGRFHLTLLGNSMWCSLARELLTFDEYIPLETVRYMGDFDYRSKINRRLSSGGYGTILQPRFFREPFLEDRLALASGSASGSAFAVGPRHLQHQIGHWLEVGLYTRLAGAGESWHELRKNRAFFDMLGVYREIPRPELPPPPAPWHPGEYIVLLPGGGKGSDACWPPERWGAVLSGVSLPCAVAGSGNESALISAAATTLGSRAVPLSGNLDMVEFAGLLANAAAVVGNDTGGVHFAAWSGIPALAVCGGGYPGWYYPYPPQFIPKYARAPVHIAAQMRCTGCRWRCSRNSGSVYPCISAVSSDVVAIAWNHLWQEVVSR